MATACAMSRSTMPCVPTDVRFATTNASAPVGNTVDEANATYLNNIGDGELRAFWRDPDFNPNHRAVYYVRVLEIPDTDLAGLRCRVLRHDHAATGALESPGARLHESDLVYTLEKADRR